ncbi:MULTISPECIES: NUDIX domain-containing protein [unclassified Nocardiopsis]|uniref:NUDIX hydrolase n=1 Tax=unclassified Nocardiopsis TaxID=2649073 RepID=UPI00135716C5|nr:MULTISPECIES: NUDIX domain-containing protein [unclassified Nocardiopsis]
MTEAAPTPTSKEAQERFHSIVDVHVILRRGDGRILLLERGPGLYGAGQFHLPSGHLEQNESLDQGAVREAWEETGLRLDPTHLDMVALIHHRQDADHTRIGVFFASERWQNQPYNREPDKCARLLWADPAHLPSNTIAYPAEGIRAWASRTGYVAHGW